MNSTTLGHLRAAPFGRSAAPIMAVVHMIGTWRRRRQSRRLLASLDVHALQDIGLAPPAAEHEANLPFWRAR